MERLSDLQIMKRIAMGGAAVGVAETWMSQVLIGEYGRQALPENVARIGTLSGVAVTVVSAVILLTSELLSRSRDN